MKNTKNIMKEEFADMVSALKVIRIAVHCGSFHADDVMAIALAIVVLGCDRIRWSRVENPKADEAEAFWTQFDFVVDVGMRYDGQKFFDHHMKNKPVHSDGTPGCGASLFAMAMLEKDIFEYLFGHGMRSIAKVDNGVTLAKGETSPLSWVGTMNPTWDEEEADFNAAFAKAVEVAVPIVEGMIRHAVAALKAKAAYEASSHLTMGGTVLVLDRYVEFETVLEEASEDVLFAVFPSNRGGYCVQALPPNADHFFEQRISMPKKWVGKLPAGASFVHPGRWLAAFETQAAALEALTSMTKSLDFKLQNILRKVKLTFGNLW